jgi:uncharacterized repeat protein (TIGR03803 family)
MLFTRTLLGLTVSLAAIGMVAPSLSADYKVIHNFAGGAHDGSYPYADVRTNEGSLYGTTAKGGRVFKIAPDGTETLLYTFTGKADGYYPYGLTLNLSTGDIYGITSAGGFVSDNCLGGCGVIYKIASSGAFTVLHRFNFTDGLGPIGRMIRDGLGNLYGVTVSGGNQGNGTIFELTAKGAFSVLYRFTGGSMGGNPFAALDRDSAGNLFGTASEGGAYGHGVVFKLTPGGSYSVLHAFSGGADGDFPMGGLAHDGGGNHYGTTEKGGANNSGTIFKLTPTGSYTQLYSFTGGADGKYPQATLWNVSGILYGTAWQGGKGYGTVFKMPIAGGFSVVHSFTNDDGAGPYVGLTSAKGYLYGTTFAGGANGQGVVFSLTTH